MPYSPTTWTEGVTTLGPTNMNHLEAGVAAAIPKDVVTTAGDLIYGTGSAVVTRLGIGASGTVLGGGSSAPAWVSPPGTEIGYDQITSPVTVTSTTEATGTTVISAAAHTFDGSPVLVEFYSTFAAPASAAGAILVINLFEAATQIGRLAVIQNPAAGACAVPVSGRLRFTPTAGSHTYSVTAYQSSGNGTIAAGSGGVAGSAPAFIRFTKV